MIITFLPTSFPRKEAILVQPLTRLPQGKAKALHREFG